MRPPVKTRFQTLIADLKDTTYDSYWNKKLGKSRDETAGLPEGADALQTYGISSKKGGAFGKSEEIS